MGGAYATFSSAGETAQTDQDHFLSVLLLLRVLGPGSGPGCLRSPRRRRRSHPRKRSCSRSFWPSVNDECARECWTNEEQMFGCVRHPENSSSCLFYSLPHIHPSHPPSLWLIFLSFCSAGFHAVSVLLATTPSHQSNVREKLRPRLPALVKAPQAWRLRSNSFITEDENNNG